MLVTMHHFSLLPKIFSTISKREIIILSTFNLLALYAFNLVKAKILLLGESQYHYFAVDDSYRDTMLHYYFPKQSLVFSCLQYKSFENAVGKGEIACNQEFLLFL